MTNFIEKLTVIAFGIFLLLVLVGAGSDGPIENRAVGLAVAGVMGICLLVTLVGIVYLGAKK